MMRKRTKRQQFYVDHKWLRRTHLLWIAPLTLPINFFVIPMATSENWLDSMQEWKDRLQDVWDGMEVVDQKTRAILKSGRDEERARRDEEWKDV